MSVIISGTEGVTFNDASLQGAAASPFGLKNRLINSDMRIDQRNAGASVTPTNGQYTLDRYAAILSQASKFSVQQNAAAVTPPTGFTNYLGVTSLSSYAVLTGDYFQIVQAIEGYNISDLAWGTANAKTVTLSFWVRSSLTGTFAGAFNNAANNRSYVFNYTISSANTWEQKTITVAGDTTGTWGTTNGIGINVRFSLGGGSTYQTTAGAWTAGDYFTSSSATSVVGTNGATFYITGVQLEQNTSATPFERRLYNQELANCQRYFYSYNAASPFNTDSGGYARQPIQVTGSNTSKWYPQYPVPMRVCPTISSSNIASTATSIYNYSTATSLTITSVTGSEGSIVAGQIALAVASGLSLGNTATWRFEGTNSGTYISFSAEL
jgi:hypothetical protein